MSLDAIRAAYLLTPQRLQPTWPTPATQKLVLLALASWTDDRGSNAFPSLASMASMTTLTRRAIQKALDALAEQGFIEVVIPAGRYKPTTYRVCIEVSAVALAIDVRAKGIAASMGVPRSPMLPGMGEQDDEHGRTGVQVMGVPRSPDPIRRSDPEIHTESDARARGIMTTESEASGGRTRGRGATAAPGVDPGADGGGGLAAGDPGRPGVGSREAGAAARASGPPRAIRTLAEAEQYLRERGGA